MGFTAPNHTQTPNDLFDKHMKNMGEAELKVVLTAVRKTLGYHKRSDKISLTQFEDMSGLSRQGVVDGLEEAIANGYIRETGELGPRGVKYYELVIEDAPPLVNQVDQSAELTRTSQASRPELVKQVDTQNKLSKEKEIDSSPSGASRPVLTLEEAQARYRGGKPKQENPDLTPYQQATWRDLEEIIIQTTRRTREGLTDDMRRQLEENLKRIDETGVHDLGVNFLDLYDRDQKFKDYVALRINQFKAHTDRISASKLIGAITRINLKPHGWLAYSTQSSTSGTSSSDSGAMGYQPPEWMDDDESPTY